MGVVTGTGVGVGEAAGGGVGGGVVTDTGTGVGEAVGSVAVRLHANAPTDSRSSTASDEVARLDRIAIFLSLDE